MFLRFKTAILLTLLTLTGVLLTSAQQTKTTLTVKEKPAREKKEDKKEAKKDDKKNPASYTAEQVAESVVLVYSGLRGRDGMSQVRKTTIERGKVQVLDAEGKTDQANYEIRIIRGDKLKKEKIRLDQEFPGAKYALIYSDDKIFGIYNNSVFAPRADATKSFQNRIWHGIEGLLRYKENESKLELGERQKIAGVDFYLLNVIDKDARKTTYYISSKTFRVMSLEYEEDGVKYKRRFYDYNMAQGTLVPFRTVLWAGEKQIEETEVGTVTYGQKVEDSMFSSN